MVTLCLLGAVACLFDYRSHRIPNEVILLMFFSGIIYSYLKSGFSGAGYYVCQVICWIFLFFIFYILNGLGAGDVKLLAVMAGSIPQDELLLSFFLSFAFALLFSLFHSCDGVGIYDRFRALVTGRKSGAGCVCLAGPILLSYLIVQLKGGI